MILHCREAETDMLPMLHEAVARGPLRGVMHSFSADLRTAETCLELGLDVSFSGAVTYTNKKFESRCARRRNGFPPTGFSWRPTAPISCRTRYVASSRGTNRRTLCSPPDGWPSCAG